MDPFIGEIKLMAIGFTPQGWLPCDGRSLQVNQNAALYSLIGNFYGGNTTSFNLPDLRGRAAVHCASMNCGSSGGSENVVLDSTKVPAHNHLVGVCTNNANKAGALNFHIAAPITTSTPQTNVSLFASASAGPTVTLDQISAMPTVSNAGGNVGHNNMQPFLALNYFIATVGVYPQRS